MNHPFLVKLRYLSANLSEISDEKIDALIKLRTEYTNEAEKVIIQNSEIGKAYLISNLQELINDLSLIETRVKARLDFLLEEGLDEYDKSFANSKEVILSMEDGLSGLLQLLKIYFPDLAKNYKSLLSDYLPFDITTHNLKQKIDWEEHFNDERSNEEIFLSKVVTSPISKRKFESLDELIDLMISQANFDFNKYKDEIEQEIATLPTRREFTINREFEKRQQDFKILIDGNLIIDTVLISDKFPDAFKELAHIINHLDSEHITYIVKLTINRLALLKKIHFLNSLILPVGNDIEKEKLKDDKLFLKGIGPKEIKNGFEELGFLELEKVKVLSHNQLDKLYVLLAENNGEKAPHYLVAMLDYLDFLTFLSKKLPTKEKLIDKLFNILQRNRRSIKGNIAVLGTSSKEDDAKYRAKEYRKIVLDNYNSL